MLDPKETRQNVPAQQADSKNLVPSATLADMVASALPDEHKLAELWAPYPDCADYEPVTHKTPEGCAIPIDPILSNLRCEHKFDEPWAPYPEYANYHPVSSRASQRYPVLE